MSKAKESTPPVSEEKGAKPDASTDEQAEAKKKSALAKKITLVLLILCVVFFFFCLILGILPRTLAPYLLSFYPIPLNLYY